MVSQKKPPGSNSEVWKPEFYMKNDKIIFGNVFWIASWGSTFRPLASLFPVLASAVRVCFILQMLLPLSVLLTFFQLIGPDWMHPVVCLLHVACRDGFDLEGRLLPPLTERFSDFGTRYTLSYVLFSGAHAQTGHQQSLQTTHAKHWILYLPHTS